MAVNMVAITGNLTRAPELRQTNGGSPVASFSVAVNDRSRNRQTGEWEEHPNFIDCVAFGNRAEWAAGNLSKGGRVAVSGRLRQSSWEADGQRRSKVEVVANEIVPMQSRQQAQAADAYETDDCPF